MLRKIILIHTSRYGSLEGSTSLVRCALRDSVIAIAELELNNVADGGSNNVWDIGVLWSPNYHRYDLVGSFDFRDDIAADLQRKSLVKCQSLTY